MKALRFLCIGILAVMISVTLWASLEKNVMVGFAEVLRQRWAAATLADAYCGFLTFYAWVFYKETSWLSRVGWFAAIMILGNIAMSTYVLLALKHAGVGARPEDVLLRKIA